jgi:hypothetical protein
VPSSPKTLYTLNYRPHTLYEANIEKVSVQTALSLYILELPAEMSQNQGGK